MAVKYRAFLSVVGLSIFTASLVGFLYSRNSLFMLSEIEVIAPQDDLKTMVHRKLVNQLGKRLTALSLREIENELSSLPRIKRVLIHKKWPSSLQVVIEEKKAVALAFFQKKLWRIDSSGQRIDILQKAQALPLIKNFKERDPALAKVCDWLGNSGKPLSGIETLEWKDDRGLVVENESQNFVGELGFANFDEAWQRLEAAHSYLASKNLHVDFLDASYGRRVVVRLKQKLQIFENELNLKELVQRADSTPAAAR